jgi:hypothetical protein
LEVTKKVLLEAVFCDQGLPDQGFCDQAAAGSFFLPPNLSYLSYEDSRKRSIKLEILFVKSSSVMCELQLNLPSIGIILIGIFFHQGVFPSIAL